jgi:hypothetical protein
MHPAEPIHFFKGGKRGYFLKFTRKMVSARRAPRAAPIYHESGARERGLRARLVHGLQVEFTDIRTAFEWKKALVCWLGEEAKRGCTCNRPMVFPKVFWP